MNVVFNCDVNESGTQMKRVAEIDGKFYPYYFSLDSAQVTWGHNFARHSERGVRWVSDPYETLESAKSALRIR